MGTDAGDGVLVTVVVVTYNGADRLGRCLDAVMAQDLARAGRLACWVVDNASADGSADVAAARDDGVRVLRSPRNLGFAGGNNLALRQVTSPYVVLLNDDAVPGPGWVRALLQPFADPRVGAVAGKLLLQPRFVVLPVTTEGAERVGVSAVRRDAADVTSAVVWDPLLAGRQDATARWVRPDAVLPVPVAESGPALGMPLRVALDLHAESPCVVRVAGSRQALRPGAPRTVEVVLPPGTPTTDVVNSAGTVLTADAYAADRGFGRPDDGRYDEALEVFGGCGASLALRTAALARVGFFDDDWFLYYEDVDLCWRLRRHGWTVRYEPGAVARHEHSASVGTRSDLHLFHDDRNRLLTLVKNASVPLLLRTVGRYPLTTAAGTVRSLRSGRQGWATTALRLRVLGSFLWLLPGVIARRRAVERSADVPRQVVETWLGGEL